MEESDKVSSTAPDEAPHDAVLNEAAAGGQTRTDARNEEEMTEKTGSPQTTEVTSTSQITEETSTSQTTEVTSTSQITEETSTSQTTEETTSQITEESGSPQITEVTSTSQITEVTSAPQTTEETKVSTSQTTEVTNSPPITEETSTSQTTEETSAPQTTEVTNNVTPQITEVTSTPPITEETSISQTTKKTSAPQIAEEISAPPRAEDTSPPQITELTSPPEPAEESAAPAEGKRGSTEAEVTSTSQTDEVIAAEATEETSPQQTEATEETSPQQIEAREDTVTPPASAARVTPAAEVSSSCAAQTVSESRRDLSSEAPEEEEAHPHTLHPSPSLLDLLHWRDVKSSALVFGSSLFVLLSLTCCSIISVLSYAALALLSVTVTFRIYKGVLQAIQKSDEGHPFKWFLEKDVALSREAVQKHSDVTLSRINSVLKELRRLFLVEDLVDSLKFAVLLWIFTHVGSWFNGLTFLILGLVGAFSGPITYEKHQTQIDQFISTVNGQMKGVLGKIQAKVPGAKKKPE
ncbi:reticulon-4b isoform X3 [Chanodichthys erythropterus]|uniref:reticulon-4b isoform X3 n=1 Tax=Chanodichthys erythropterus TaxID=933992 RepID=UPI00351E6661